MDFTRIGEPGYHREMGAAEMLRIDSGTVHLFLARKGRLVCASHQASG